MASGAGKVIEKMIKKNCGGYKDVTFFSVFLVPAMMGGY